MNKIIVLLLILGQYLISANDQQSTRNRMIIDPFFSIFVKFYPRRILQSLSAIMSASQSGYKTAREGRRSNLGMCLLSNYLR